MVYLRRVRHAEPQTFEVLHLIACMWLRVRFLQLRVGRRGGNARHNGYGCGVMCLAYVDAYRERTAAHDSDCSVELGVL